MMLSARYHRWISATLILLGASTASAQSRPSSLPSPGYLDDAQFREGLSQRGLSDWLEQYLADHPGNELEQRLRRRDELLRQADSSTMGTAERESLVRAAHAILLGVLEANPQHPGRLRWRIELARDLLERARPVSFDAVLVYELAGRERCTVQRLATDALHLIETLREDVASQWRSLESLDEQALDRLAASGGLGPLQAIETPSLLIQTWARLYASLTSDAVEPDRRQQMDTILSDVSERYGWTSAGAGQEVLAANGLLIAAVAARGAAKFDDAEAYARRLMAMVKEIRTPADRERLQKVMLVGVLEQIRNLRDRGKPAEALGWIDQAADWVTRTRPNDMQAALSVALVEHHLRSVRPGGTSRPFAWTISGVDPPEAIQPLQRFASRSPAHRDSLYLAVSGSLAEQFSPSPTRPFDAQLFAGAVFADASSAGLATRPASSPRVTQAVDTLRASLGSASLDAPAKGEMLFLLGSGEWLAGNRPQAVTVLADLAEQMPAHDRANAAAARAAAIAEAWLSESAPDPSPARKSFVRAARLYRKTLTDPGATARVGFAIARTLEDDGSYEDAAREYEAIPSSDPNGLRAALGRARSLRSALAGPGLEGAALGDLASRATAAARQAAELARASLPSSQTDAPDTCLRAQILLVLASVFNHPAVRQSADVLPALKDFEARFSTCPGAVALALRERIVALQDLKRMQEAREVVGEYLKQEPGNAGPVMAQLLDAMRAETESALDRGDTGAATAVAGQGAQLAAMLLDWAGAPGRVSDQDRMAIRTWRGWLLLHSGEAAGALSLYDELSRASANGSAATTQPADSALGTEIELARAECLLALGRAADALPVFARLWQRLPERSPQWWRALTGSLDAHTRLGGDASQIVQTIRQQRHLAPDLGRPRWKRALAALEQINTDRLSHGTRPQP